MIQKFRLFWCAGAIISGLLVNVSAKAEVQIKAVSIGKVCLENLRKFAPDLEAAAIYKEFGENRREILELCYQGEIQDPADTRLQTFFVFNRESHNEFDTFVGTFDPAESLSQIFRLTPTRVEIVTNRGIYNFSEFSHLTSSEGGLPQEKDLFQDLSSDDFIETFPLRVYLKLDQAKDRQTFRNWSKKYKRLNDSQNFHNKLGPKFLLLPQKMADELSRVLYYVNIGVRADRPVPKFVVYLAQSVDPLYESLIESSKKQVFEALESNESEGLVEFQFVEANRADFCN